MTNCVVINSSVYQKLLQIASAQNCELTDCLERALNDYIENYEDTRRSDLECMTGAERAFFFSAAE